MEDMLYGENTTHKDMLCGFFLLITKRAKLRVGQASLL